MTSQTPDGQPPPREQPPLVYQLEATGAAAAPLPGFALPRISRRTMLIAGFWGGVAVAGAGAAAGGLDLVYPRSVPEFGGVVSAGNVASFPPGSKTHFITGRFWLVHLTQEQGGAGLLALWQKCPHLGCTVPWRQNAVFQDPVSGKEKAGWFRCPCHQSTYSDAGVRVFGPAPRSMDTMKVTLDDRGNVLVDTGAITNGGPDNASRAVKVP